MFYGYCDIGTGFPELGYVSRKELRNTPGKTGLPVERDYYYTPKTLNEIQGKPEQPQMPPGYVSRREIKETQAEGPVGSLSPIGVWTENLDPEAKIQVIFEEDLTSALDKVPRREKSAIAVEWFRIRHKLRDASEEESS